MILVITVIDCEFVGWLSMAFYLVALLDYPDLLGQLPAASVALAAQRRPLCHLTTLATKNVVICCLSFVVFLLLFVVIGGGW